VKIREPLLIFGTGTVKALGGSLLLLDSPGRERLFKNRDRHSEIKSKIDV
jgi:hypothetical protein